MKLAAYSMAAALMLLGGAVTWAILRGEDTRTEIRSAAPCKQPGSEACQRQIRLILRELVRRHPKALKDLGLKLPKTRDVGNFGASLTELSESSVSGGGGALGSPPSGGGPVGRVPPRDDPPAATEPPSHRAPPEPPAAPSRPLVDLNAPVVPRVCVGDLGGVNCP